MNRNGLETAPTVSVIVPVYNAVATLERAIASALNPAEGAVEVVVVDDGSTDGSLELLHTLYGQDPRVRLLSFSANLGPAHARNRAIEAARGAWLAILDADDEWLPGRLDHLLHAGADCDFIADNLLAYDAGADELTGRFFRAAIAAEQLSFRDFMTPTKKYNLGYLKPLIRKEFLTRCGLSYREDMRGGEDFMLYATALCQGARFRVIGDALYVYTAPVGHKSKRRSPYTRTQMDDSQLQAAIDDLRRRYAAILDARDHRIIDRRIDYLNDSDKYSQFMGRLHQRDLGGAVKLLAHTPGLWRHLAMHVASYI